jgi:hypothetical protein
MAFKKNIKHLIFTVMRKLARIEKFIFLEIFIEYYTNLSESYANKIISNFQTYYEVKIKF